ncbi:unnamed protein product [Kuraishia capsulata CBS 1993]|uniref:Uncharacterized protein n=1 Tax=Kuraishia capsulata CBS 1993 TaxID=1382522 RepID=W6MVW3_9ASCO|nr:uncharacterized protein KUCA_T00002573001 [Kuraishia capsulata CBS 1993]CDK26600.1 unnamed protein product [Kuraishia capsulata CBS 1993]
MYTRILTHFICEPQFPISHRLFLLLLVYNSGSPIQHGLLYAISHHRCSPNFQSCFNTTITESPLKNIFDTNLSFKLSPESLQNSFTPSNTMLQCLSNALTFAINLWLFLRLIRTVDLFFTAVVRIDIGPLLNSYSSSCSSSVCESSDLTLFISSLRG